MTKKILTKDEEADEIIRRLKTPYVPFDPNAMMIDFYFTPSTPIEYIHIPITITYDKKEEE
jgi:hypothetical protein